MCIEGLGQPDRQTSVVTRKTQRCVIHYIAMAQVPLSSSSIIGSNRLMTNSTTSSNPVSKKLNKMLETRLDSDKELLEALRGLSEFFPENNLRARRNLRGDIERRSLNLSHKFLQAFQHVNTSLDTITRDVTAMNSCCDDMTTRLSTTRQQTADLIDKTNKLRGESVQIQMKSDVAAAFIDKFQLKPDEVLVLKSTRDGTMHRDFFRVLEKVQQIHSDCKILLRTSQQRAGLEIMEAMALHQEAAFERLYRWAQGQCRNLVSDSPDIDSSLDQAMAALQQRPVLFRYCLDEFGTARRTAIVRYFIDALTRGGPGGTPRPIELHSHDPLRYVGDMLAWLHQAVASENEHLELLLRNTDTDKSSEIYSDVLAHITEGVKRPLKVRIEQVVVGEPGPLILYKLTNLMKFYIYTIGQMIGIDSGLVNSISEMKDICSRMFFNTLTVHGSKVTDRMELASVDLSPPLCLTESLSLLTDILESYDSAITPRDDRKVDFQQIVSVVVEPILQMCVMSASELKAVDMSVYLINCIHEIRTTLALYEFTDDRLEMLTGQIEAHMETVVNEQASYVLSKCNLAYIYTTIQCHAPKHGPLSDKPCMDSASLCSALSQFDAFLSSPDTYTMSQCHRLISSTLKEAIHSQATYLVCKAYTDIYTAVHRPENSYPNPETIVFRTPDQVTALLL